MGKDYEKIDWDNWEYNPNGDEIGEIFQEDEFIVLDSNGNKLSEGDNVVAIKDLSVKGAKDIKRGDKFIKIKFNGNQKQFESGKMVLKAEFFKKI